MNKNVKSVKIVKAEKKPSKAITKYVKKAIDNKLSETVESKYWILPFNTLGLFNDQFAQSNLISTIPPGTADNQRVGDQINLKRIEGTMIYSWFDGTVNPILQDYPESASARILIVQDKSYNTTGTIDLTQLLLPSTYSPGTGRNIDSHRNVDHMQTLVVLYDKIVTGGFTAGMKTEQIIKFNIPMKYVTRKVQFAGGSSTNVTNGIFMILLTNNPAITPVDPVLRGNFKFTFTDA